MPVNILAPEDVAKQLIVSQEISVSLMSSGALRAFEIDGQWRTTQDALDAWTNEQMNKGLSEKKPRMAIAVKSDLQPLPILAEIASVQWERVAPVEYEARNGKPVKVQYDAFEHTFDIGGKKVPIMISVFGPDGGGAPGKPYLNWGARASHGKLGHSPNPLNEWLRTDDYATTKILASPIKNGTQFAKPGDPIAPEYDELEVDDYRRVITRSNTINTQCVVAKETDLAPIALHALIRCRQKGLI